MFLSKPASFKGFFVCISLALLGLSACSGRSAPSVQSPEDKAFEEVLFAGNQETRKLLEAMNGLVTAPDTETDFTEAAEAMVNATDSFLTWIDNFEQAAANLAASLKAQQLVSDEVIPDDIKKIFIESFIRQRYEECLKSGFRDEECQVLKADMIREANKLAGAVKTANGDSYLFGNSPARPSQPTTIKVTQNGESDPAALLWAFCQDFNAERKCHLISLGGKTGEILPVPFMPIGTETVKLVVKVERRPQASSASIFRRVRST